MLCYGCWKECGPVYHGFQLMPRPRSTRYLFSVKATNKLKSKVLKNNTMNGKNLRIIWWMVKEGQKGDSTYRAPRKAFPINNKTLCERIFGRGRTMCMILWTCLIAAQELSSFLTREDKSFTPLVCWSTQLIQYVPIHDKNSVTSRQCLKICTSSMQTCLEPNYNIGHKWLQPRE